MTLIYFLCKARCITTGGPDLGKRCVFPFTYNGRQYRGCTLVGVNDGIPWCSTLTDARGIHVSGQGKWGKCSAECNRDASKNIAFFSLPFHFLCVVFL